MSEQRIDEKRLVEIEAWAELVKDERWGSAAVALDLDLVADLRAARAEIERLKSEADRRVAEEREACAKENRDLKAELHALRPFGAAALAYVMELQAIADLGLSEQVMMDAGADRWFEAIKRLGDAALTLAKTRSNDERS